LKTPVLLTERGSIIPNATLPDIELPELEENIPDEILGEEKGVSDVFLEEK
jgi:hypothetical protein